MGPAPHIALSHPGLSALPLSHTVSATECQYNRDRPFEEVKDGNEEEDEDDEALGDEDDEVARHGDSEGSASSRRSSLDQDAEFAQKVHRLQTAKEKLRHLQELVTMVQVGSCVPLGGGRALAGA